MWALLTPSSQPPAAHADARPCSPSLREPRIATGMWIVVLVGLMFGTLDVLAPLRLDELGASAGVIGATFVAAGALEATMSPFFGRVSDRHGRVLPCLVGLGASGVAMALLPWPEATIVLALIVVIDRRRASASCGRRRWRCCPTAPTTSASTRATRSR